MPRRGRIVVRCYGYPGRNNGDLGFYPRCVDLDLVVWRPTVNQARSALKEQILLHLETLRDLVKEGKDIRHLLPRRAPLAIVFGFDVVVALVSVRGVARAFRMTFREIFADRRDVDPGSLNLSPA